MEKKNLLLYCATTLLLAHCWVACLTLSDESALLSIKSHFTFHPHNILATNWTNTTSYCHWFGVTCNTTPQLMQRVIALDLSNMSLQGTIAPQVGNLSQLEELYLGSNHLSGEIPKEISNLGHLRILLFPFNNLSGSIPSAIFNISSLQIISLSNNSLSGTLPIDMCNSLPKLQHLFLPYNQLRGKIPTSLDKCTELRRLSLGSNAFTGSIPKGIENLTKLEVLFLGSNNLTEYGSEGIVSTSGDVYSYGIMLMETFTRKKPTDEMFTGEVNLRSWVESLSNNTVMEIVDTNMLRRDEHFAVKVNCISSIMTLALECTTESPEERINMKAVVARLKKIRIKLLAGTRQ